MRDYFTQFHATKFYNTFVVNVVKWSHNNNRINFASDDHSLHSLGKLSKNTRFKYTAMV